VIRRKCVEGRLKSPRDFAAANDLAGISPVDAAKEREIRLLRVVGLEAHFVQVTDLATGLANEIDAEVRDDAVVKKLEEPWKLGSDL
jgi:hypothetical protein